VLDAEAKLEIANLIQETLGRFGMPGVIEIHGTDAVITGSGETVRVPLGNLATSWNQLDHEERSRLCRGIARGLVTTRRSLPPRAAADRGPMPPWMIATVTAAAVVAVVVGAYLGWQQWGSNEEPVIAAPIDYVQEREDRARRVCEATRVRVTQGARIGSTDVEGWVVEMTLLRPAGSGPGEFLDGAISVEPDGTGRVAWSGAPALATADGGRTGVEIEKIQIGEGDAARYGVRLAFRGRYVSPFFRPAERIQYIRLANRLAKTGGAAQGALYARCEDSASNHMGAWFRGRTPTEAAAALLYFGGAQRNPSVVASRALSADGKALDPEFAVNHLEATAKSLKRSRLAELIGKHGGMIAVMPETTTLRFPLHDVNGASRAASRSAQLVSRELGVAAPD
jgi:hypothetical protein